LLFESVRSTLPTTDHVSTGYGVSKRYYLFMIVLDEFADISSNWFRHCWIRIEKTETAEVPTKLYLWFAIALLTQLFTITTF